MRDNARPRHAVAGEHPPRTRWARGAVILAVVASVAVAACGDEESDSGASASGGGETTAASPDIQAACDNVDAAMVPVEFAGPGSPIDVSKLKGKTIWYIGATAAVPLVKVIGDELREAAAEVGVKTIDFDGKGVATEMNKGVEQAVANDAGAIVLFAIAPVLVEGALEKAEEAGIPVVDALNGNPDDPLGEYVDGHVTFSYTDAGSLMADYAICDTGGKVNTLIFTTNDLTTSPKERDGMLAAFEERCPDCTSKVEDVPLAQWQQRLPTLTKSLLVKDPKVNYIHTLYDGQVFHVAPAVAEAGATSRVKIISLNADTPNLKFILDGTQVADLGHPNGWLAWAIADQSLRVMSGEKGVDQNIPLRMFDKESLEGVDINDEQALYGDVDYRGEYRKLWGIG